MKVLLIGARGQVGQALVASAPVDVRVVPASHEVLDIGDPQATDAFVAANEPHVIVNCAAYTAVDRAESEPDIAQRVNADGAGNLARSAARAGSRLVQLSTDFVFDGRGNSAYRADAAAHPLSVYGRTKLAGEQQVLDALGERAVVLRTSWVYAPTGKNFVLTMLRLMRERGSVRVVSDQVGTPTASISIAAAVWASIARPAVHGIHHWTDAGIASWYDFAVAIADEWAARTGAPAAEVIPIGTSDYPTPARRPAYSVLDRSGTIAALDLAPRHWRHNLRDVIGEIPLA